MYLKLHGDCFEFWATNFFGVPSWAYYTAALNQLPVILYLKISARYLVVNEEDLSITVCFIRNVTYNYCALSTEVPLLFILCLKLRMCHSICSRVGVFPRYCTCKWSRFSERRRTNRTEIDWPYCIMYLFVTDSSVHSKTYSCSLSARIWISNCFLHLFL